MIYIKDTRSLFLDEAFDKLNLKFIKYVKNFKILNSKLFQFLTSAFKQKMYSK